jgi:hypothetical protein
MLPDTVGKHTRDELNVAYQIALPQSAWLKRYAEEPLEAACAKQFRRSRLGPRNEIECGADGDDRSRGVCGAKAMREHLLLGCAETDPYHVRVTGLDGSDQLVELVVFVRPKWRNLEADDLDTGEGGV